MTEASSHRHDAARDATIVSLGMGGDEADASVDSVLRLLGNALDFQTVAFCLLYEDQHLIKGSVGRPMNDGPRGESFCQIALDADDDLFVVTDAETDERTAALPVVMEGSVRSCCGLAIHAPNGITVGYLCGLHDQAWTPDSSALALFEDARSLIESSLLLRDAALRDPLTGLFNRRYFDDRFEREIRRAYRLLAPMALFIIDIDNFKAYNDLLGQKQGDDALVAVANALRDTIRRGGDLVARYSVGQFVIILPNTNVGYAELLAERLRNEIRELQLDHPGSQSRRLTISCGGAVAQQARDLAAGSSLVLAVAEQALYQARQSGEGQFMVQTIGEAFDRGEDAIL